MYHEKPKFDSVILAGGFGKRLNPLTDSLPKPMLPIASKPALERNLGLLRKYGFNSTAVTTMYLPERIESVKRSGVEYFREEKPLGSAGAIRNLRNRINGYIAVISGDAIFDFDLSKARDEFLKSGCDAAMLLCRSCDSGEYGSVCVQGGRIVGFCEKPSPRDTMSDLINTGIYFLKSSVVDLIPEDMQYDFGRDLFPALLKRNIPIAGIEPDGHWFDIGSFGEYHRCNMWVSKGESCFGSHVSVHPGAEIKYSVIMDNCTVGNSFLRGCILGENVTVGNDCIIPPGCVIGPGAELRDGCALAPGSIVQSGDTVIGKALVEAFPEQTQKLVSDDDSIIANDRDDGYFVRLGRMLGDGLNVISFADGKGMSLPQACELACGAAEAGSGCTVLSGGNAPLASFAAAEYRSRTAFIYSENEQTRVKLFSSGGMPISREELRRISSSSPEKAKKAGSVFLMPHGALIKRYIAYLKDRTDVPQSIRVSLSQGSAFLREAAEELGVKISHQGPEFYLTDGGERVGAILEDGTRIGYWQLLTICCIAGEKNGIILPNETPCTVERILRRNGIDVAFYGDSESDMRRLAEGDALHRDGVLLALTVSALTEKLSVSLEQLAGRLPPFSIVTRSVYAERSKMNSTLSRLREECGFKARCAGFEFGEGRANVYASASGRFRIIAEATDSETAEEIALHAIDELGKK